MHEGGTWHIPAVNLMPLALANALRLKKFGHNEITRLHLEPKFLTLDTLKV